MITKSSFSNYAGGSPRIVGQRIEPLAYRGGEAVRHAWRVWSGVTARLTDLQGPGPLQVSLGSECNTLSAILDNTGGRIEIEAPGERGAAQSRYPVSLVQAGQDVLLRAPNLRHMRHLVLQFDPATVPATFDRKVDLGRAFRARSVIVDDALLSLCRLFASECEKGHSADRLFGESLVLALLQRLSQLDGGDAKPRHSGGLAPWQLRRVTDYMEANFGGDVSLDTLAALARLSTTHFSRAFKRSTAMSPHQWLIDLRCSKAKQFMLERDMRLAEIAFATGFSDQAHFTRVFGRSNGIPPAAWRRAQAA